ncbi:MAG: SDR family NAD(P)-dependent oxidoreductase, partial [bacterium]
MYKKLTDLSGKRALVTGGGRGIGLCAADALAEAGACVVIVDLSE